MKRLIAAGALMTLFLVAPISILHAENKEANVVVTTAKNDFKNTMKKLWENDAVITRDYITSVFTDHGDTNKIREDLLANMEAAGNAVKPYYGADAEEKFVSLLKKHLSLAEEVMKTVKTGNYQELIKAQAKWNANADDLISFLISINHDLKQQSVKDLLYNHLQFATDQMMSWSAKDPVGEATAADKDHENMLQFADTFANSIIKQFPKKFKK